MLARGGLHVGADIESQPNRAANGLLASGLVSRESSD
jgi:hypothetical protein